MENNRKTSDEINQNSVSHNQKSNNNNQEQQSNNSKKNKSHQENADNRYLSNGYLDDKERYDDAEL